MLLCRDKDHLVFLVLVMQRHLGAKLHLLIKIRHRGRAGAVSRDGGVLDKKSTGVDGLGVQARAQGSTQNEYGLDRSK